MDNSKLTKTLKGANFGSLFLAKMHKDPQFGFKIERKIPISYNYLRATRRILELAKMTDD
jgi:hypothetical protein